MKILITGGAGYIGSHIALDALLSNHEVLVVDNLERGYINAIKNVEALTGKSIKFYKGDVGDQSFIEELFSNESPEVVIHCAGYKSVGESETHKEKYTKNNVENSKSLIELCQKHGVKKFIFSSSASIFGDPQYLPLDENHPTRPINHYGLTKLLTEVDMETLAKNGGPKMIALRYFNAIGNHESGIIGEDYRASTNFAPLIFATLKGYREKVNLFGDNFNTTDGTQERDYIHVMDIARAHVIAAEKEDYIDNFSKYNLSTEKPTSCKTIIELSEKITNKKLNFEVTERRKGDPEILYSDNSKAKKELGWVPVRDIETSLKDQWKWYENNDGLYK